jgi:outer membrane cobalamin receptor
MIADAVKLDVKNWSALLIIAAWLGSMATGPCLAQDEIRADSVSASTQAVKESLQVYRLQEILVTASRLPSSQPLYFSNVTVASRERLRELSSSTITEALTTDSGIGLMRYGSYGSLQTMSLRGGSSNEVIYLLDGVPIADPQIGVIDLNWLPMSGTARVEAIKGGASSIYGSGAVGGALNIVSMDAMPEIPSSEITAWRGSFASRAIGLTLRRSLAGRLGFLGAYDYLKSGGWVENSAYKGEKFYGKFSHDIRGLARFDAVAFRHTGRIEIPGCYPGVQEDRRKFVKLSLTGLNDNGFAVNYYHSNSHQTYVSGGYPYRHDGNLTGGQLEVVRRSGDRRASSLGLGFEMRDTKSSSVGKIAAGDVYGSFQEEVRRGPLRLSGTLRLEKNSQFSLEAAPQVALWYFAGGGMSFFSKSDRSFMYPSFNDLYWTGPHEAGNPDLKTEHSRGFEVGTRLEKRSFEIAASLYYRHVDDMILWRTDAACNSVRSTNAQARLKGSEISCRLVLCRGVEASLSYWVGSASDEAGKRLEYRPSNIFAWFARAERPLSKHIMGGVVFAGKNLPRVTSGDQLDFCTMPMMCVHGTSVPPYSSGLLYGYLAIDRARLFARVNNLFNDRIYSTWGTPRLPRRSYEFGISWEIKD